MVVEFRPGGSAEFNIRIDEITPAQLSTLLVWLQWYVNRSFEKAAQAQEAASQAVPEAAVEQPAGG